MALREDTVVSQFPPQRAADRTPSSRANAAIALLREDRLPVETEWDDLQTRPTPPPVGLVAPRARTLATPINSAAPPARRPPRPSRGGAPPAPARPAAPFAPIPEACFEASVVAEISSLQQTAMVEQPRTVELPQTRGRVVTMFSCRGGAGSTTLAVNTAAQLVRCGKRVCVVDFDLQLGDVFVALNLDATTSMAALAREASTIDATALRRRLASHPSGVFALTQVGHVDDIDQTMIDRLPALVSALADHFDYVIIDGVRDFGDSALAALDMSDELIMILTQDVAAVRRAARAITLFRRLGYSDNKVKLVVNRCVRKAAVSDAHIAGALGMPITARVRNSYAQVHRAFDEGALLGEIARTSGVADDLTRLADILAFSGKPGARAEKQRWSWLPFRRG